MIYEKRSSNIELNSQDIKLLKGMREEFKSLLEDYKDEIPPDVVSGPCIYKCQNGWFAMMYGRIKMASINIPSDIVCMEPLSRSLKRAKRFIDAYANRNVNTRRNGELHLAVDQNIKSANLVIKRIIREIDAIINDQNSG